MDAFTLVAKLILDKSEFDAGLAEAESAAKGGGSGGKGITALGVAAGHVVAQGAVAAAKAGVNAAKDVIKTGMAFDDVMAQVRSVREMTDEQFDAVRNKALDLGESTVFTATQVGEALYYMGVAGWDSQEMISGISGVLDLAAASGENLATSSDIVTDALTAFGLTADDTGHFVNVLAAAAANSNTTVGMMGEAFKYVAPVAGAFKYTAEDVAVGMGLMANNGIKASQSGTALRQILNGLIDPGDDAKKAMQKLGISMYEANGRAKPFRQLMSDFRDLMRDNGFDPASSDAEKMKNSLNALADAYESGSISAEEYAERQAKLSSQMTNAAFMKNISDIVGVRGLPALLAIMKATDEEWDELASSIDNSEGEAARMAKTRLDTLMGDITLLQSALDGLKLLANDEISGKIRKFIQDITKEVGELSKAFEEGGLAGMFNNLTQWMLDGITSALNDDDFAQGAAGFGQALGDFVGRLVNSLLTSTPQLMEGLFNAGMGLATGLIDGLFAGLFGGDDSIGYFMDKAQKEQQDAIDQANENAIKASGIADYLDSLIKKYGDAASSTKEWAAAMEKLNGLLPGASAAMSTEAESLGAMVKNLRDYVEQLRELSIEQAKQNTLNQYREKINENLIGQAMAENERDIAARQVTAAQQAAYDLLKKDWEHNAWRFEDNPLTGQQALRPEMIDLNEPEYYTALHNAIDYLNSIGENEGDWSFEGLQEAYESASSQLESATSEIATLQSEIDTLRQQLAIAEKALADMADNAEDTADETEDLNGIADEAGDLDLSGLQGAASSAESSLNGVAASANVDFGAVNSANGNLASAFNSLAARANSVSFAGIGGGALGGGGSAPTVVAFGSHAKGAWEIPYDEYPAMLHRGEMVLTASQARRYRNGDAGDLSADAMYQAVAEAVQKAVASIQINMDGAAVGNAVTKQVSRNIYRDQYGRRFATV